MHIQATKQTTLTLLERRWLKYSFTVAVCIGAIISVSMKHAAHEAPSRSFWSCAKKASAGASTS